MNNSSAFDIIGVIHLRPLPAAPLDSPGFAAVLDRAMADAEAMVRGGIRSCIIENLGETLDAVLDPVLARSVFRKGRNLFLKMGGDINRVVVLPVDMDSEQAAKEQFKTIDASQSRCYLEADRQRLLAVVEKGA